MTTATRPPRPSSGRPNRAKAAALQRQRRRRRRFALFGGVGAVIAVVLAIVLVSVTTGNGSSSSSAKTGTPDTGTTATVLQKLFNVPGETLDVVGSGSVTSVPKAVSGAALTANGKPLVLYLGAEYCPYCAAERWPLIQALSRFGTFDNLTPTTSAAEDVHPNTPSFTFHGATYASQYLAFDGRELFGNQRQGSGYAPLDTMTPDQTKLLSSYGNAFPLLDMGGKYVVVGSSYDPTVLHGKNWQDIAAALTDPNSPVARGIDGSANVLTAALCKLTGGQPSSVCAAPAVATAAKQLHG